MLRKPKEGLYRWPILIWTMKGASRARVLAVILLFELPAVARKKVSVGFGSDMLSSDAGVLLRLLAEIDKRHQHNHAADTLPMDARSERLIRNSSPGLSPADDSRFPSRAARRKILTSTCPRTVGRTWSMPAVSRS
jgi:hypothetical protein